MKQFVVQQERSAMKIGTDGVLLGAWTPLDGTENSILDVGAGTGIIALMMAQRSNAELIDALELDEEAFEECVTNFETSPWGDRLFCYHASFQEFVEEIEDQYDLIVSNPPFFNQKNENREKTQRNQARFTDSLYFEELIEGASLLLSESGKFAVIIPYQEEDFFIEIAEEHGLYLLQQCRVKGRPESCYKRSLLLFSKTLTNEEVNTEELCIETSRHKYTDEYIALTKDFYVGM
jgi:tRNA1Val (adenine37-N6)-methyltransferase